MVWVFNLFQNCPQFIVIHTVKDFGIVNKAEIGVFLELSCFFDDPKKKRIKIILNNNKSRHMCLVSNFSVNDLSSL